MTFLLMNWAGIVELSSVGRAREAFGREAGCYNASPRETMSNLVKVVAQLRKQRDAAQKTVDQLDQALAALGTVDGPRARGRKGRTMSAADRRRIAVAQRARWAKWKAARRKK